MSTGICGPGGCGDCTLACAGGRPRTSAATEDLTVVAAGGVAIAVLAGVLVPGAVAWVAVLATVTAAAGLVLATSALVARSRRAAEPAAGVAAGLLPYVTGGFLLTVLARAATSLLA